MGTPTIIGLTYQLSLFCISFPLHIYWLFKWKQHQNHFVIRHRFPQISIAIFIIAVIVQISAITYTAFGNDHDTFSAIQKSITQALSFLQEGLVFYRVHLIYVRYAVTSQYLATMITPSDSDTDKITINKPKTHKHHVYVSNSILIVVVGGTLWTSAVGFIGVRIFYAFLIIIVMGIVIVINLLRAKVQEAIGCVQESGYTVFSVFMVLALTPLGTTLWENREKVRTWQCCTAGTAVAIVATIVLFLPIRAINRGKSMHVLGRVTNGKAVKLTTSLCTFLEDAENYKVFAEYLSRCFALESLLFCERVLILYHLILKYKNLDTAFVQKDIEETE
eukprot:967916_1